jgi:hypothetical protein
MPFKGLQTLHSTPSHHTCNTTTNQSILLQTIYTHGKAIRTSAHLIYVNVAILDYLVSLKAREEVAEAVPFRNHRMIRVDLP